MNKVYYLSTCSTCNRIIDELDIRNTFELQNIKEKNVSKSELASMAAQAGSYESLFSKRAMKYRAMGLHEKDLSEKDFESLILQEYTFLKRPVIQVDDQYFVGNSKKVVQAAKEAIEKQ